MTDDHNTSIGTKETFDKLSAQSAPSCSVDDWQCFLATSWVYTGVTLTNAEAVNYHSRGFELGVHAENGCTVNFSSFAELDFAYKRDLQQFQSLFPGVPAQRTSRFHCIVWSDWVTQARVQLANGIRYNMDYYYYPDSWLLERPGLFTGSGFPI